jgi:DNA modification methylase
MLMLPCFTTAPEHNHIYNCKAEHLLTALQSDSIDMILTSPPYDNLRSYRGFAWDFEFIAHQSYRVLKRGGVLVWVVGDATIDGSETLTSFRQALYFRDAVGFRMHDTMIWRKFLPGNYGKRYCQAFEYMFVFAKGTVNTFNAQLRRNKSAGTVRPGMQRSGYITDNGYVETSRSWVVAEYGVMENVWDVQPIGNTEANHPAVFPEQLAERHILTWSNPGDLVLDFFVGSGTTAKMARNNGRRFIGCDIAAEYVALANKRLDKPYTLPMFAA